MNKDLHTDPGGPSGIHEDLLVKYLLGETSPDDNTRVEAWLAAHPANRHYYQHFQLIWRESRRLEDDAQTTDQQTEAAWQKFRQKMHRTSYLRAVKEDPKQNKFPIWLKVAAVLLIAASITGLLYLTGANTTPDRQIVSTTTPVTDTLPDGSFITLNKASDISYPAKFKKERTIHLKGEAFFRIAPDKEKPFKVFTGDVTITVLGTSFNVSNNGPVTEIIVESGLVRVTDSLHDVLLHPSEKLILHKGDATVAKDSATDQLYKYYRTKEFVCDNTPLWQLAETLEKAYGIHIQVDAPIRHLHINTTFRNQSPEEILSIIKETFRINYTLVDGRYILQP